MWGNFLIFYGGFDTLRYPHDYLNDLYVLDCSSPAQMMVTTFYPSWHTLRVTNTQFAPSHRTGASATVVGNALYIFGGRKTWEIFYNDLHTMKLSTEKTQAELDFIDRFLDTLDGAPQFGQYLNTTFR